MIRGTEEKGRRENGRKDSERESEIDLKDAKEGTAEECEGRGKRNKDKQ